MNFRRIVAAVALLSIAFGVWARFNELGAEPLQSDEAVNWYLASTSAGEGIQYDPAAFHGPLYFRLLAKTSLQSEAALRLPSAICGILTMLTPLLLLGSAPALNLLGASALIALDPVSIYYSRTAIHESLFVLFCALFTSFIFLSGCKKDPRYLIPAGIALGLMASTKETFVIPLAAATFSGGCVFGLRNKINRAAAASAAVSLFCALLVGIAAFGGLDSAFSLVAGVQNWRSIGFASAQQSQPWWYYIAVLSLVSPASLLALLFVPRGSHVARYFSFLGMAALLAYTIIPYKTPWLLYGIVVPLFISVGMALKNATALVVIIATVFFSRFLPFERPLLASNSTSKEVLTLAREVSGRCTLVGPKCRVLVVAKWYWPLPFYFRSLGKSVVYSNSVPSVPISDFDAVVLPADAVKDVSGWRRTEFQLSRLQKLALYQPVG